MLKVACPRQELLESVQIVSRGVSGRSTQPVQNNILLEASEGKLGLLATDLEYLSLQAAIGAEVSEEGQTTVPARIMAEVIAALPQGTVELEADTNNSLRISCGRSKYEIRGLSANDFERLPELESPEEFELPQSSLHRVLSRTVFSTSRDETRPILTGALLQLMPEGLEVVATDTYRLALQKIELPGEREGTRSALVSRRALTELMRIVDAGSDEMVTVRLAPNLIEFGINSVTLGSRLIEGTYVNYPKVIPASFERALHVNVKEFNDVLHRALIVAREDANRVVLRTSEGMLNVRAYSQDVGEVEESLPVKVEGDDAEIAFNARYMLDMLEAIDTEELRMELRGPLHSGLLRPAGDDSYLYVLMPMQIM